MSWRIAFFLLSPKSRTTVWAAAVYTKSLKPISVAVKWRTWSPPYNTHGTRPSFLTDFVLVFPVASLTKLLIFIDFIFFYFINSLSIDLLWWTLYIASANILEHVKCSTFFDSFLISIESLVINFLSFDFSIFS